MSGLKLGLIVPIVVNTQDYAKKESVYFSHQGINSC